MLDGLDAPFEAPSETALPAVGECASNRCVTLGGMKTRPTRDTRDDLIRVGLRVVEAARVEAAAMRELRASPSEEALQAAQAAHMAELDAVQAMLATIEIHLRREGDPKVGGGMP